MTETKENPGNVESINPPQQSALQAYLNMCAAIGERAYKVHCLKAEIEDGFKKASDLEKQIVAEQNAVKAFREQAEKEAEKITG